MNIFKNRKNRNLLFILSVVSLLFLSCSNDATLKNIEQDISDLKSEYAPDTRVARFEIEVDKSDDTYILSGHTTSLKARDALLKKLDADAVVYKDKIISYPDSTVGNQSFGIVNLSACNIRSAPKHSAELATQELLGTILTILSKSGEWYLVQTPNKYIGWLDHGGFIRVTDTQLKNFRSQEKVQFNQPVGWVYAKADMSSEVVSDIVAGSQVVDLKNTIGLFSEIELPDGRRGFIQSANTISITDEIGESIIYTAQKFMGVPYLWGGTSSKGFDCSGYTKTMYALNGYLLPRDASQQVNAGELINTDKSWKNLIPGDLLFFGSYRDDGSERITHVAIYMGDGKIIHAAGRVKVESLNPNDPNFAKDRYETFIKAKRMVSENQPLESVLSI